MRFNDARTMEVRREKPVEERLLRAIREHPGPRPGVPRPGRAEPLRAGSTLTGRRAIELLEVGLQSRLADLEARRLKDRGVGYYTIGSAGHEPNAVFGTLLRPTDPALLHYRSGAFMAARARTGGAESPIFDTMLALVAAADDPVSGGRHKVFGNVRLGVAPQTSTIASHLPKAVGQAFAIARARRLGLAAPEDPPDRIVYCSFGDASINHASAQAGFHAAAAAALQRQPCPVLFVCEDNGFGISVRTPPDFVEGVMRPRAGLEWFAADGRDWIEVWERANAAIAHCRRTRRPVFFHLRTVRLMGHAGTDIERTYLSEQEIEANEARDPLLTLVDLVLGAGLLRREELLLLYEDLEERIRRAGEEAARRPHLRDRDEVTAPLRLPDPKAIVVPAPDPCARRAAFPEGLPERDRRRRHLAFRLSQALRDLMATYPEMAVFGEDVARKGGVYHVTDGLQRVFGAGRVFNTILDETTILGLAQGMAFEGFLPVPEIQYLAYLHNAIDQVRGEAASMQFFSKGQVANPMVVRIAAFAYQKGFGGHFHNDDSVGALLDVPGLILAAPARVEDAVGMLRTCAAAARQHGKVCVFLEPIALYMTRDLHEPGDGLWLGEYPPPPFAVPLGEAAVHGEGGDLTIVSYANGLYRSLQAQARLAAEGIEARVVDLRWLAPLPIRTVAEHARATGRLLVVDECRRTGGGPSAHLMAELVEDPELSGVRMRRLAAADSYVPLGPAADLVLVQADDVVTAAREMVGR